MRVASKQYLNSILYRAVLRCLRGLEDGGDGARLDLADNLEFGCAAGFGAVGFELEETGAVFVIPVRKRGLFSSRGRVGNSGCT